MFDIYTQIYKTTAIKIIGYLSGSDIRKFHQAIILTFLRREGFEAFFYKTSRPDRPFLFSAGLLQLECDGPFGNDGKARLICTEIM